MLAAPKFTAPVQNCTAKLQMFHWTALTVAQIEGTMFAEILTV
jgi:hypothetical protein